eukprot:c21131_g1_i1 orf=409-1500(-)
MKIQCDVCEKASATLLCCADEAALCAECDTRVHAANKLASKHQRVLLISPPPNDSNCCDICQEKRAYFFCLEDRALLCRNCDFSIHTSNALTSSHKRFLVSGLQVSLHAHSPQDSTSVETTSARQVVKQKSFLQTETSRPKLDVNSAQQQLCDNSISSPNGKSLSSPNALPRPSVQMASVPREIGGTLSQAVEAGYNEAQENSVTNTPKHNQNGLGAGCRKGTVTNYPIDTVPGWRLDELLYLPDMAIGFNYGDNVSSKADTPEFRDLDWDTGLCFFEDLGYGDAPGEVPQMPFLPTVSGLSRSSKVAGTPKGKNKVGLFPISAFEDDTSLVPDLGDQSSPSGLSPTFEPVQKRRRHLQCTQL